jgi:hypothetical protein
LNGLRARSAFRNGLRFEAGLSGDRRLGRGRLPTGGRPEPSAALRYAPMAGEVTDIDPRPHHQFWVCGENEIRLFRSHRPSDGKTIKPWSRQ